MPMLEGFLGLIGVDSENGNAIWFNLVTEPDDPVPLSVSGAPAWFRFDKSTAGLDEGALRTRNFYQLQSNRIKVQVYHGPALTADNRLAGDSFAVTRLCRLTGVHASGPVACAEKPCALVEHIDAII